MSLTNCCLRTSCRCHATCLSTRSSNRRLIATMKNATMRNKLRFLLARRWSFRRPRADRRWLRLLRGAQPVAKPGVGPSPPLVEPPGPRSFCAESAELPGEARPETECCAVHWLPRPPASPLRLEDVEEEARGDGGAGRDNYLSRATGCLAATPTPLLGTFARSRSGTAPSPRDRQRPSCNPSPDTMPILPRRRDPNRRWPGKAAMPFRKPEGWQSFRSTLNR